MNTLHYLPCVISDSVDKRVELNKRSLDIRNSGNEKHERHDQLAIMDSCIRTMHTMRDSSKQNCSPCSYMYYNPQHYQLIRELKEARKGFFGCYSVCETMKDTKEGYFIM